jgi:glyoxylase-like metal-dependent hydrolase (beta-lactamase superfamily II)
MKHCTIHPIPLALVPLGHPGDTSQSAVATVYVWYIEGAGEKILVDTGLDVERIPESASPPFTLQTIESGLNSVGLGVDDIDTVILTHLHFDHVGFASRFSKARMIVQKRELEFARNPHPLWQDLYPPELLDNLKFEVIEGDFQVTEDVNILFTPGHSPGGQSVSVMTDDGIAIIAGLCTRQDNFSPWDSPTGGTVPVSIPLIYTDVPEAYDSLVKIKETADIILPLHDAAVLLKGPVS